MNNEPVAWMQVHHKDGTPTKFSKVKTWGDDIPLYTHPAKTLTDEEILEIANQCLVGATAWHNPDLDFIEFAKAILRKAQEK